MFVLALFCLVFGFTGLLLLDGQVFNHAVIGLICGLATIASGLASARKENANASRRWLGRLMAAFGLGLAVFCINQIPSAYRYQEKFNTRSKEFHGRTHANPAVDFQALGFDNVTEAGTLFDTYKEVFTAQVSEDYWEEITPHQYSIHHFKATVTKSYKGDWKPGERVSFSHDVDAPAITTSNTFAGGNMLLLTDRHANNEILFGAGDFFLVDSNVQQVLRNLFPDKKS